MEEMKNYLRVDFDSDDELIIAVIEAAQKMCMDIARTDDEAVFALADNARVAVMYAAAYLYEHREEANHHDLTRTLSALLFSLREGFF